MRSSIFRSRTLLFYICSVLAITGSVEGQDYAGKPIAAIRYRPAAQPLDSRDSDRMLMVNAAEPLLTNQHDAYTGAALTTTSK